MFKQNFFLFLRNIRKNKSTFLISCFGLGIGIASFIVLALYVYNDLTYNHFHKNITNIYRVMEGESDQTKGPLLPEAIKRIPEIEDGTRIFDWDGYRLSNGIRAFEENVLYVDSGFFSVFSFPLVEGNADDGIREKFGAVISSDLAKKYFGDEPAIGKKLQVGFEDQFLSVQAVVEIPSNSTIQFDIVTSYETGETISPWIKGVHDWYNTFSITYVQLKEGTDRTQVLAKFQDIVKENFLPVGQNNTQIDLLPFKSYHSKMESNGTMITILAVIALGILIIAIVNTLNLSITNSLSRTREVGIKKVHGATRKDLFLQLILESLLMGLSALVAGVLLVKFFILPGFNNLFETKLLLDLAEFKMLAVVLLLIWLGTGLICGSVPALLWARGKLVHSLKGELGRTKKPGITKNTAIIVQFMIATVLITGTFLIRKQVNYMMDKDPMFDLENLLVVPTNYWQHSDVDKASENLQLIASEMEASPFVNSIAFSGPVPGDYNQNYNSFFPEGKAAVDRIGLRKAYVGEDYFKTMGIEIKSGHGFDKDSYSLESTVVLNKKAMEVLGYERAEGQIIREAGENGHPYRLIGTIDNFSYQGVQHEMQPLAHFYSQRENYVDWDYLTIRSEAGAVHQVISLLEGKWKEHLPEATLDYQFANVNLDKYYDEYRRINTLVTWFSILAIILSCTGLFAMAGYAITRRTKEIGVRKVNGASISQVLVLLNKDFLKWVLLAFMVACPLGYYGLHKWLEGFAYRTDISWWLFAAAALLCLAVAFLTVSWHSYKAATINPVNALREE
ncbi:MAG: ABC transporter permease [Bacteroidota bacterium]